jgi:hypothetical protein
VQNFTQGKGHNPFELPHVHATGQLEALNTLPNRANLVVLAPTASLEVGLARELLFTYGWACDPANSIILPFNGGRQGSVAQSLADHAAGGRAGHLELLLEISFRVPLTPEELVERQAAEDAKEADRKVPPPSCTFWGDSLLLDGSHPQLTELTNQCVLW